MSVRRRALTNAPTIQAPQPRPVPQDTGARRLVGAMDVPIEQVAPDPIQPRRDWQHDGGEERLAELAASIKEFGILQPLLVREDGTLPDGRQRYLIIAGGRRFLAAQRVGLITLPVVVRGDDAAQVRVLQLIENLQRQNLSPIDEARAYQELMDLENLNPPAVAVRVHVSAQHVRDRLRLLADQVLADAVERRQISARAARDISQLPDEEVHAFRKRVQAGEHLQANDVAKVRARLAADGVINPRLKRAEHIAAHNGAATAVDSNGKEQTRFVPQYGSTDAVMPAVEATTVQPAPAIAPPAIPSASTSEPPTAQADVPTATSVPTATAALVDSRDLAIVRLIRERGVLLAREEALAALHEDIRRLS